MSIIDEKAYCVVSLSNNERVSKFYIRKCDAMRALKKYLQIIDKLTIAEFVYSQRTEETT